MSGRSLPGAHLSAEPVPATHKRVSPHSVFVTLARAEAASREARTAPAAEHAHQGTRRPERSEDAGRNREAPQPGEQLNTVQNPHYAGNAMPDNLPEDNFVFFYHPDHLGSTEYVTDYAGELYEHTQYFAFGETWVSEHKNTEKLPYLFTSKELDEETGLYYFGARYYDPRTSVWQSPDPALPAQLGDPFALSAFSYARLSPLKFLDPTGLAGRCADGVCTFEQETLRSRPEEVARIREKVAREKDAEEIRRAPPLGLGAPPARGNVGLLSQPEFKIEDTSETWRTAFEIATIFAPGGMGGKAFGKANIVYRSVSATGRVQYVGITNNLARRAAEHLAGRGIQIEKLLGGLSRSEARAVEQALIEIHGLGKKGGTLMNRINSIARSNPA